MKTVPVKLNCSNEDKEHLLFLLNEKQKCFNYLSDELFKLDLKKYLVITKIHNKFYNVIKEKFP